jgi:hypothetical protein
MNFHLTADRLSDREREKSQQNFVANFAITVAERIKSGYNSSNWRRYTLMAEDVAESAGAKAPAITISTQQIILMAPARGDAKPGHKVTTVPP